VETQWDRLSGLSDDAWKGVPKGVFPQAFQLQEHPRIMWNAKKLSYACKKFVERQNCDATILQGSRWVVAFFWYNIYVPRCEERKCTPRNHRSVSGFYVTNGFAAMKTAWLESGSMLAIQAWWIIRPG
jgi:hypothetical protein